MQSAGQSNSFDSLHEVDLQALSRMPGGEGLVFSLYLNLRPQQGESADPLEQFEKLLSEVEKQKKLDQIPSGDRAQWNAEVERIRSFLSREIMYQADGMAVISSAAADLWHAFLLPVPVQDRLVVKDQPFVRPLEVLKAEFECTLVALVDSGSARIIEMYQGQPKEVDHLQAVPVTGGDSEDGARQFIQSVVERIESAWEADHCRHLVIGGTDEKMHTLRDELPGHLHDQLAGEVQLSPDADLDEVLDQVGEIERSLERTLEEQRVDELIAGVKRNQGDAIAGLEQTLLSVRSKNKVRMLIVEEDFHQAGGECPNCGFLTDELEHNQCLVCGVALHPEPDIIEAALKRALDHGAEIEILRSEDVREALEPYGKIGALLNTEAVPQPYRDAANQIPITDEGEIDREALRDETIEESFPASDPPSWTH